jgi:hypothetical protein
VAHSLEARVLDLLVARLVEMGLLKAGGKQRTDSSHVLAAVRQLNQIELVGEGVRACVEALAAADPDWVATHLDAGWQWRYGARVDSWRMPTSKTRSRGGRRQRMTHPFGDSAKHAHRQSRVSALGPGGHVGSEDVVRVAIEVLARPVVAHRRPQVGMAGGDLHIAQADPGVEHGRHESMAQM